MNITQDRLKQILNYDPSTGLFTWKEKISKKVVVGAPATSLWKGSYGRIQIEGVRYASHRLAWLYMTGEWPDVVDHVNGDGTDNRWANLRNVDTKINTQNIRRAKSHNRSQLLGVKLLPNGKFKARVCLNKKEWSSKQCDTAEEAHELYLELKRRIHDGCSL